MPRRVAGLRRRPRSIVVGLVALAVAAGVVAGCGSAAGSLTPFVGSEATVRAVNVAFEPTEITLPAGAPLRIVLDNQDGGVPHNVKVLQGDLELGKSPTVTGPAQTEVRFGPLAAARYQFVCDVHPNMIGTLIVGP
jgi:plastocyanin